MTEPLRVMLLRPWRDPAFRVLALALAVAAFSIATVLLLRAELDARFQQRSAEVLGGETVLEGSRPAEPAQLQLLADIPAARVMNFATVVVEPEQVLLVSAKAVSDGWPLFGQVTTAAGRFEDTEAGHRGPAPGELWVGDQLLDRLAKRVGDSLTIGSLTLPITRVVKQEPDQGTGFYSMNPRVLMHVDDIPATGIIGPGTRYRDEWLLKSRPDDETLAALKETLRPDQEIEDVTDAALSTLGPLKQLTLWVALAILLVTLLCGAAVYLTSGLRVRRRARLVALLRTFGATRQQVYRRLLVSEVLALAPVLVLATGAGIALLLWVRQQVGWDQPLAAGLRDWLALALAPLLLLMAYVLPRIRALVQVPAMAVLRDEGNQQPGGLALAAALAAPLLIAMLLTGSLSELVWLLALLVALAVLLPLLLWPLLVSLEKASHHTAVVPRLALRRLTRRPMLVLPLLAALLLSLSVMTLSMLAGQGLLEQWREKLPAEAPNYFAFNVFDADLPALADWQSQHGARSEPLYPIVRGRLTLINGEPVREAVTKESDRAQRNLNRDLALTESAELPDSNRLLSGAWLRAAPGEVSVESELAEALQLQLGDTLQFITSQDPVNVTVTSIREVDWESFAPNFYFMFSPGTLDGQDVTWLTSFWLPAGHGSRLAELMSTMPHITLLDVNALLDKAQGIVEQASDATAALAVLLVIAAVLVLLAALLASQQQRASDQALLRTLGASDQLIARVDRLEFLWLAGLAAGAALLVCLAALAPLAEALFDGHWPLSPWLALPLAVAALIWLAGVQASRRLRHRPALDTLRQG